MFEAYVRDVYKPLYLTLGIDAVEFALKLKDSFINIVELEKVVVDCFKMYGEWCVKDAMKILQDSQLFNDKTFVKKSWRVFRRAVDDFSIERVQNTVYILQGVARHLVCHNIVDNHFRLGQILLEKLCDLLNDVLVEDDIIMYRRALKEIQGMVLNIENICRYDAKILIETYLCIYHAMCDKRSEDAFQPQYCFPDKAMALRVIMVWVYVQDALRIMHLNEAADRIVYFVMMQINNTLVNENCVGSIPDCIKMAIKERATGFAEIDLNDIAKECKNVKYYEKIKELSQQLLDSPK
ncbi:MAG: hypothetical protein H9536_14245 [Aphanizomenon flos-aquae Clear-A1]|nr:hypothetical protein [Aphanizomenon flos-aquae Clear-A1]